jgi:hypothetical protein
LINPPGSLRIAIKTGYPFIQSDGFSTFTLERQRTDANKVVTKEPLGTTPTKIPFRNLQIDIADFANAIRPLIEPRIDFQAGDVIVITGSLEFLNPSQPRVDMTTKMTIKIDLNRCATIAPATNPPATNLLPAPAPNPPANQIEELKALPETNSSYRYQSQPSTANNKFELMRK